MNVFCNTIVFVKDLAVSKAFYEGALGLKIEREFDTIVFFENHFVLHDAGAIQRTVFGGESLPRTREGADNLLIYLETDDLAAALAGVQQAGMHLIHGIQKQDWGQRVFRFYDPDGHIVEIGESMHVKF